MKQPKAAGATVQALEPLVQKLADLEGRVLGGETMSVAVMSAVLAEMGREIARQAMMVLLDQAARTQPTRATCTCGAEGASRGFKQTFFVGRFGRVPVSRRQMECPVCDRRWFAFDEAWRLPPGEYADDVREATDRMACRLGSFKEAVEEVRYMWGVEIDPSTAQRWVGEDGARAAEAVRRDSEESWRRYEEREYAVARGDARPAEREKGFGVVEVDGVHALTWKPGQEPRRKTSAAEEAAPGAAGSDMAEEAAPDAAGRNEPAVVAGETSERALRHQAPSTLSEVSGSPMGPRGRSPRVRGREVCVGLTYLGEDACEESPGRGALLDKRYVVTLNDREGFWKDFHAAATAQGALAREKLLRISDGGTYFIEHSDELFRDQPLVGIIDIQHVNQHVWEAGHKVVHDTKETKAWAAPRTEAIRNGQVDAVIVDLGEERSRRQGTKQRKAIDDLTGYLSRHRHLMDYPAYEKAGYPIASAAIESTNKRLVARRCKQGGMIWSEPGLEAMLAVRVAFYNPGAWQRLWPHTAPKAAA